LRLTPEGEALLEQARTSRQELIAQVLDGMTSAGRDDLASGLAAFQRAAEPEGLPEASSDGASDHRSRSATSARGPGGIPFSISA
jgi:hypothetical protein